MTEDNWNVKYKCVVHSSLYPPGSGDANMIKFDDHEKILEILRRKLIEDIEELFKDYSWEQNFSEEVINIINKRFGVK